VGKKIYVGNLSFKASQEDIGKLFSRFGEVVSISIIMEPKTGRSRGFGFVEMATNDAACRAIRALSSSLFMERTLAVSEARPARNEADNATEAKGSAHDTDVHDGSTEHVSEQSPKKEPFRLLRKKGATKQGGE